MSGERSRANRERWNLSATRAKELEAATPLSALTWDRAAKLVGDQEGMDRFRPDALYAVDPRTGGATLFNQSRARRPHDNPAKGKDDARPACVICEGHTTAIVDRARLSEGFTFINENLYPIIHPRPRETDVPEMEDGFTGRSNGLHFVQWTSSYHDVDWPQLGAEDRVQVLDRLAELERRLLELPGFPDEERYVSIIKNVGRLVGGSLSHPHQQITLSNCIPGRTRENRDFQSRTGHTFADFMLAKNPPELTVRELDTGRFMIPYFMRRPYDLLYVMKNTKPRHLHETSAQERRELGDALAAGMNLTAAGLEESGREEAYNVVFHTGPGTGIYLEFLPKTQEEGGFERVGLSACQSSPFLVAQRLSRLPEHRSAPRDS